MQFVGLDGFDTSSCKWLSDAATQVGQPAFSPKVEDEVPAERPQQRASALPRSSRSSTLEDLQVLSKSIVRDVAVSLSRKVEESKHGFDGKLPLPRIKQSDYRQIKPLRKGRRQFPCRGKLVYEEEPHFFPEHDIMDRLSQIKAFGRTRNLNFFLGMGGKPCKLPPIGAPFVKSSDSVSHENKYGRFPYHPGTRGRGSGRGDINGGHNTGIPTRRKERTGRKVPPNLFGYREEPEELAPTLVRKCGGGGFATSVDINERQVAERALFNSVSKACSFPRLKGKQSCISLHSTRSWKST